MLKNLLSARINATRCSRLAAQRYGNDPRFNPQAVLAGYARRTMEGGVEDALLSRICKTYRAVQSEAIADAYLPTMWWSEVRRTSLGLAIGALANGDTASLQRAYGNFFRDSCSAGLVIRAADVSVGRYRQCVLGDALYQVDHWQEAVGDEWSVRDLRVPEIGNPFGIELDGVFIRDGSPYQHYCAQRIRGLLENPGGSVLEIGGGYGGMAYYLLRDLPRIRYINLDLPESIALASYYLIKALPDRPFTLQGEEPTEPVASLMPLQNISEVRSKSVDVVFSSHAISDLTDDALSVYLGQIVRIG